MNNLIDTDVFKRCKQPLIDETYDITNKKLAKEITKQINDYKDNDSFVGWDMILRKFVLKKFK